MVGNLPQRAADRVCLSRGFEMDDLGDRPNLPTWRKGRLLLILEGAQGIKKSTALKTIADPWFTDEIADLGSKDAALQTRGVWLIEIAELDSMNRTEVGRIRAS